MADSDKRTSRTTNNVAVRESPIAFLSTYSLVSWHLNELALSVRLACFVDSALHGLLEASALRVIAGLLLVFGFWRSALTHRQHACLQEACPCIASRSGA